MRVVINLTVVRRLAAASARCCVGSSKGKQAAGVRGLTDIPDENPQGIFIYRYVVAFSLGVSYVETFARALQDICKCWLVYV